MPLSGGLVQVAQELGAAGISRVPDPVGGGASDVTAFETWLAGTAAGSTILFPPDKTYLQASMVRYLPQRLYVWPGVDEPSTRWKVIDGTNMGTPSGMWVPQVWDSNSTAGQLPVEFDHPCLDGNKTLTTGSHHGLIMGGSHWYRIRRPYIFSPRGDAIHLTNLAKNGTTILGSANSNDMADGGIFDVRLQGMLGCGIRQALHASVNAHMDVLVHGGRIFDVGQSGILGDRISGWDIDAIKVFGGVAHHGIRATGGWYALTIRNCVVEEFGTVADAGTYYGIGVTGFVGHGCSVAHNRIRQAPGVTEPGSGVHVYLNVDYSGAAGTIGQADISHNVIRGPDAGGRAGNYGVWYQGAGGGTLYVTGRGTNLVNLVANAVNSVGSVQGSAASAAPFV